MQNIKHFLAILLFGLILSFQSNAADKPSTAIEYIEQSFDVEKYRLELDLSSYLEYDLSGRCVIYFNWTEAPEGNSFFFNLLNNTIDSCFYYGEKVNPIQHDGQYSGDLYYSVEAHENSSIGQTDSLIIYYHTDDFRTKAYTYWGGVHLEDDVVYSLNVGIFNPYFSTSRHWMPCYDHPSDKVLTDFTFIVPEGLTMASIGMKVFDETNDGLTTTRWVSSDQCATYLFTFAAGDYAYKSYAESDLPIDIYYYSATPIKWVDDTFDQVYDMVQCYESYFGEYPFEKVGYCMTKKGSMESQTMINLASLLVNNSQVNLDGTLFTVAHELSHMWFGNMVSPLDFRETWLNEGFAVFCEALWKEYSVDYNAYLNSLEKDIHRYINFSANPEDNDFEGYLPLYDYVKNGAKSNYPWTIYQKGAAVVGMLRYEMGDEDFFAAINDYLEDHKYGNVTTEDLKTACENHYSQEENLDWFFDQWIYQGGWPKLDVNIIAEMVEVADGEQIYELKSIEIDQMQSDDFGLFENVMVEITFHPYGDGPEPQHIVLNVSQEHEEYQIDGNIRFVSYDINKGPSLRSLIEVNDAKITSIDNIANSSDIKIYPNPTDNFINIEIPKIDGEVEIILSDINGREVYSNTILSSGSINRRIPTNHYASGAYILTIKQGNSQKSYNISIAH